jgi:hypothetical protein
LAAAARRIAGATPDDDGGGRSSRTIFRVYAERSTVLADNGKAGHSIGFSSIRSQAHRFFAPELERSDTAQVVLLMPVTLHLVADTLGRQRPPLVSVTNTPAWQIKPEHNLGPRPLGHPRLQYNSDHGFLRRVDPENQYV